MSLMSRLREPHNIIAGISLFLITILGLLNLRSADYYSGDSFHQRQVIWFIIGYVALFVALRIDIKIFERLSLPLHVLVTILLVMVFLVGKRVNNSIRWIEIFGFRFQPSEMAKLSAILVVGRFFNQSKYYEYYTLRKLIYPFLLVMVPCLLILMEPDLGTTLLILSVTFSMILYEGIKLKSFLTLVGVALIAFPVAWELDIIRDYQKDRVKLWLHLTELSTQQDEELLGKNLQSEQALWSVGSGGISGKGILKGAKSRLKYFPLMQTDFVMATYSEEHGFVGVTFLLLLYMLLIYWCFHVADTARDKFGALLPVGVGTMLLVQLFMNVGMVIGIFPVVGITLPLMSYGGTSVLITLFCLGLVFNISINLKKS